MNEPRSISNLRHVLLWSPPLCIALALLFWGPIPQDPAYHAFADQRSAWGVAHGQNVWSNVLFFFAGLMGLTRSGGLPVRFRAAAYVVSISLMLVALGSAYYHEDPRDATLAWDRLPLAVAFMAALVLVGSDRVDVRLSRALVPAALIAFASIGWWVGTGDLRFYAWVQFGGLLLLIQLMVVGRNGILHSGWLWCAIACYALAKGFEMSDVWWWQWSGGQFAGHMVKHVVAGFGAFGLVLAMPRGHRTRT
ncbi:MAG: hypothetical protein IPK97_04220 [Ahniella sp.]|nr:hypothetical protein [Ahniella sp.]